MKIIQFVFSLGPGGAERLVVDLSNELAAKGHEVHLVVLRDKLKNKKDAHFYKPFLSNQVVYHNLRVKQGLRLSAFIKSIRKIKSIKPDIVHCHANVIPFIFPLALISKKNKFFHTLHSIAPRTVGHKWQKGLNRYFYASNKIFPIAISDLCKKSYQEFYKLDNIVTIENGRSEVTKTNNFASVKQEVKLYTKSSNIPIFIHIAGFSKEKNQNLLIDSFNKVFANGFEFILLIIGSAFETVEGKKLQEKACDRIIFLGEKLNVNDYLLCSDAFCLSSDYEGLPISLLEALSAGCVPICTPVGGIPDVITDGVTGYLSDSVTLDSYYNTIMKYIQDPHKIARQVLNKHFEDNFSIKICAEKYNTYFMQIIEK